MTSVVNLQAHGEQDRGCVGGPHPQHQVARSNVWESFVFHLRWPGSTVIQTKSADVGESNFQEEAGNHPLCFQLHTCSSKAFIGPLVTLCPSRHGHLHHCLLPCVAGLPSCTGHPSSLVPLSQLTWFHWKAEAGLFFQPSFLSFSLLSFLLFLINLYILSVISRPYETQILDIFRGK